MTLSPGSRLGPYEVIAPLGAGGMGEVYRARDTKLRREVALKVLPDAFAKDPDRLARFTREAHLLASLNHPHIAAIYGFEEDGHVGALILELVEGMTLAERIAAGPLPVEEALGIARQIAEALEAAHERGIVHRDLKPANVKLTPEGSVKVLDFGLAKALAGDGAASDVSHSPTMTAIGSHPGGVIGTAPYMSPEQAKGMGVDKRTDIWAFGCVLYEMLSARRAFGGETVADVVAALMTRDPDWTALRPGTPARVRELLRRCLRKDPRERVRDIGDARIEIEEALRQPTADSGPTEQLAAGQKRAWRVVVAAAAGVVLGAVGALWIGPPRSAAIPAGPATGVATRTVIELPASAPLALGSRVPALGFDNTVLALSPDGTRLAYVGQPGAGTLLYLRAMDSLEVKPVPGTEGATLPFFSPDGRWLGFLTDDKVKKVSLDGGQPITLCDATAPVRASWARDDTILFEGGGRLSRVPASGGVPREVVTSSETWRKFDQALPGGEWALFTDWSHGIGGDYADVVLVSLATRETKRLVSAGYDARYVAPGYLLFGRSGNLLAVPFDLGKKEVSGEPVLVASGVSMESFFGNVQAAVSDNGLLVHVPGSDRALGRLAWVDRRGATEFLQVPPGLYGVVDLAPNGERVAVHVADVKDYVWIYDIKRQDGRRLTGAENSGWPVWSPDSNRIALTSSRASEPRKILIQDVQGRGTPDELFSAQASHLAASSWSLDGLELVMDLWSTAGARGFLSRSIGGKAQAVPAGAAQFVQMLPVFSPDGRFVAYTSDESSRWEIWVRSHPDEKIVRQISVDGGVEPVWCPCGELFYRKGNRWFAVPISTSPELRWGTPRLAFETDFIDTVGRSYDVSADGKRLLVVKRAEKDAPPTKLHVVSNWLAGLKRPQ